MAEISAATLIDEAAALIGDVNKRRVLASAWLVILNRTTRKMAGHVNLVEVQATFDLTTEDRYPYPDDCVQVTGMAWNDNPSGAPFDWWHLDEKTEQWLREQTDGQYQDGDPEAYIPQRSWFSLYPRYTTTLASGGRIQYLKIPNVVTEPISGTIDIPHFTHDLFVDGMLVEAHRHLKMYAEARELERQWRADFDEVKHRIEDRGNDKRPNVMPRLSSGMGEHV